MNRPAVSVIVPAWNVAEYIGTAVASVLAQTYRDWELIVVNDGSPDTPALEQALESFRDRLTYIVQPNQGAAGARNTGLAVAQGRYAAFLDGDDVWLPEFLEAQMAFIQESRLDLAYADAELFGKSQPPGETFMGRSPSWGPVTPEALLLGRCHILTSATVARIAVITELGGFEVSLRRAQDFDMWFRVAKAGGRIGFQRRILAKYRMRAGSLSGDEFERTRRELAVVEHLMARHTMTRREGRAAARMIRRNRSHLEALFAKQALRAGEIAEARRRTLGALRVDPSLKLLGVFLALLVAPGLVRRRMRPDP